MNYKMKIFLTFSASLFIIACNEAPKEKSADLNSKAKIIKVDSELIQLNQSINSFPSNPGFFNKRALYFLRKKETEKAYEDLKYVFTLDSFNAEYYNTLADYHIQNGEPGKAEFVLNKSMKLNPNSFSNRIKMGELYYLGKKYKLAFKYLNEGLKINKYVAKAYYLKGLCFKEMGALVEANSNFQTAIEQDPDYYEAYIELALHNFRDKFFLSKQYYTSALRVRPNSVEALYGLGFIYQSEGKYEKAQNYYQEVLKTDSNNLDALYNLSVVFYGKERMDSSVIYIEKVLTIAPNKAEAIALKAWCKKSEGKNAEAKELFLKALQISPNLEMAKEGLKN